MGPKKEKILSNLLTSKPPDSLQQQQRTIPKSMGSSSTSSCRGEAPETQDSSATGSLDAINSTREDARKFEGGGTLDFLSKEDNMLDDKPTKDGSVHLENLGTQNVSNIEPTANPDAPSLELSSLPHAEVEVNSLTPSERPAPDHAKTCSDSSKLSVVLSNAIPLSFGVTDKRHGAPIPNVTSLHRDGPSSEVVPLACYSRQRQDHDYCIQAFTSADLGNQLPMEGYDFPLSDVSGGGNAQTSFVWRVEEYQPSRVAENSAQPTHVPGTSSVDRTTWNTSSCWGLSLDSKEDMITLHNIGLTAINLERLAETGSISESLFLTDKSEADKRNDRVQKRRETFVRVMAGNSKKQALPQPSYPSNVRNNPLVKKWFKLDELEVDEISKLLDDITDIIYQQKDRERRRQNHDDSLHHATSLARRRRLMLEDNCPSFDQQGSSSPPKRTRARVISLARRKLHCDGHERNTADTTDRRMESPQQTTIHRKIRELYAKSLASTTSRYKERLYPISHDNSNALHANPPTWERSRSICSRQGTSSSVTHGEEPRSVGPHRWNNLSKQTRGTQGTCRNLRSRTVNISTGTKSSLRAGARESTKEKDEGRKGAMAADHCDNSNSNSDWITLSEKWMSEPLDTESVNEYL